MNHREVGNKKSPETGLLLFDFFLDELLVPVAELVHTTSGINELHLSSKEGVRFVRDLQLHQWVFISVFMRHSFTRWRRGATEESVTI